MKVRELISYLVDKKVNQDTEVFWSGLSPTFQERTLQKVGKVEDNKNYVVLTPGAK